MDSKDFWISKKLTEKAALVLADMGIDTFEDLVGTIINEEHLLKRKDCAEPICHEIINFRRRLLPTTNTSHKKVNRRAVEILKKISVDEVAWDIKTYELIQECRARTIYDLAMINLPAYRGLRYYNLQAYHNIKSKVFEILTELNSTFSEAHKNENISLNIFVEKPKRIRKETKEKRKDPGAQWMVQEEDQIAQDISLQDIADKLFITLDDEEKRVIRYYYGFDDKPKTFKEIADCIHSNRENIRHIKEKANHKAQNIKRLRMLYKNIRSLYEPFISALLAHQGDKISVQKIRMEILLQQAYSYQEMAIFNWFADILGDNWFCCGSQKYKADSLYCYPVEQ